MNGKKIIVGVTGGIAAFKICSLVSTLVQSGADVRVMMTTMAQTLIGPLSFQALSGHPVMAEGITKPAENGMNHIELALWGDLMVIAPCTANVLGKMAHGIGDDNLTTQSLAFGGPQLIVPAMNPRMWAKASVQRNVSILKSDGFYLLNPAKGRVACGEEGEGRMQEPEAIIQEMKKILS